ncbi:hypothetical protein KP509_08G017900 [Ceratopteris richardii]|uniref:Secreted protein n=1 Tax=Ceratopteris richardii TaxID=49495 RepID=A0A8T2UBB2_CERRI|nr:hypothetical protein KP509_08G017900 [Ceratopteris richardii]
MWNLLALCSQLSLPVCILLRMCGRGFSRPKNYFRRSFCGRAEPECYLATFVILEWIYVFSSPSLDGIS